MIVFNARDLKLDDFARHVDFAGFRDFDYNRPYDFDKENTGQGCLTIGTVPDPAAFSAWPAGFMKSHFTVVPVKAPGSDEYRLPDELKAAEQTIRLIAAFEHAHNPDASKCLAVVQLRKIRNFVKGTGGTWHLDFTRQRYGAANDEYAVERFPKVDHLYLAADRQPTIVTRGTNREPLFAAEGVRSTFNAAALERDAVQLAPYQIGLLNSYGWHKAPALDRGQKRTFLLMTYREPKDLGGNPAPG